MDREKSRRYLLARMSLGVLALYSASYFAIRLAQVVRFSYSVGAHPGAMPTYNASFRCSDGFIGEYCLLVFMPAIRVEQTIREDTHLIVGREEKQAALEVFYEFRRSFERSEQGEATDQDSPNR